MNIGLDLYKIAFKMHISSRILDRTLYSLHESWFGLSHAQITIVKIEYE